jgi:hypothetical protein
MSTPHTRVKAKVINTLPLQKAKAERRVVTRRQKKPKVEGQVSKLPAALRENQIKPNEVRNPAGAPPGMRLMTRIREILGEKSLLPDGRYNTRFDDVADAFVRQMETGSFPHMKEFIEREEGKVTQPIDLNPSAVKMYEDVPVDGPEAP